MNLTWMEFIGACKCTQERTRCKLLKQGKMTQDLRDAIMIGVGIALFGVLIATCEVLIVCLLCNR